MYHRGRGSGLDHEIGARETEQIGDVVAVHQQGIDVNAALLVVQNRDHERNDLGAIDRAADDIRGFVAIERRTQHLQMEVPAQLQPRHTTHLDVPDQSPNIAVEILERQAEWDGLQYCAH